jgi:hypothetical protein
LTRLITIFSFISGSQYYWWRKHEKTKMDDLMQEC